MPFVPGHAASPSFGNEGGWFLLPAIGGAQRRIARISDEGEMSARAAALTLIGEQRRLHVSAGMRSGDLRRRLLVPGLWKANASEHAEHQSHGVNS